MIYSCVQLLKMTEGTFFELKKLKDVVKKKSAVKVYNVQIMRSCRDYYVANQQILILRQNSIMFGYIYAHI